ncbi:MAG: DUF222 domain-containing protein [Actinomycetota bacterium]
MSMLRSALDELRAEDLRFVGDDVLATDLDELERATRIIEAERARRLAEFERRGCFALDGHLSMSSWLAHRHRVAYSAAASQVRLARALASMPSTTEALASGEVSSSAVALLLSAREACPEEFSSAEGALVDAARTLSVAELKGVVAYWRQSADVQRAEEQEERLFERRRLHISPTLDGMVRVDGDLDPETGQTLITALRAVQDAEARTNEALDLRTPAQRRADALGQLCRRWLDSQERPSVAGERPHVVVTIDLDSLEGRVGHRCQLEDAGRITPETARRWACDANVTRVVTDGESQPLDVGRRTKVVPAPLRRAVAVRDGGCTFPGCGRPPGWSDAHHVRHWADGGPTALENLILLCRPHHRVIHRGFGVEMLDGTPRFTRPDGTVLDDRAPPVALTA